MNGKALFVGMAIWQIAARHVKTTIAGNIKYGVPINSLGML